MLAHSDPHAQALMQWGSKAARATAAIGRTVAEANPIVGTFNATSQAVTGKDAIDPSQNISGTERAMSGVQAAASIAAVAGKVAEAVGEGVSILQNATKGIASEKRVLQEMGLTKNTAKVSTAEGKAIPDALTGKSSIEIKDTQVVNRTKQIRIQTDAAKAEGKESVLVTGSETHVSVPAQKSFDKVIQRPDLGPQQ